MNVTTVQASVLVLSPMALQKRLVIHDYPVRNRKLVLHVRRRRYLDADKRMNYFTNRATNAAAESLNSKMKAFKAQLHGVADMPFFMYRLCMVFG